MFVIRKIFYNIWKNAYKEMVLKCCWHCYYSLNSWKRYKNNGDTHLNSGFSENTNISDLNSYLPLLFVAFFSCISKGNHKRESLLMLFSSSLHSLYFASLEAERICCGTISVKSLMADSCYLCDQPFCGQEKFLWSCSQRWTCNTVYLCTPDSFAPMGSNISWKYSSQTEHVTPV